MRRFPLIPALFFSATVFAQKQFNVLDWKADVTLNTYLVQQMHRQYDERRVNFSKALASKSAMFAYIASVRKKMLQLLGDLPERSPLNTKITGTIQQEGYRIEKIIYESFSHHHVTANLYLPDGKGPFPAALLFCGHEDVSKATESYQKTAILFARNGFVVLVIDPISQSERYQLTDNNGKPLTRGGTTEHTLLNEISNLLGSSVPAYELWDNERGLDYLVTRPEVDTAKIGCLGNSGGGMQTIYFAAYDKRIKVIAPCSYLSSRERTLEMTGPADGCAQMPNEGKLQMELNDYLIAAAPKPVLVLAGRYDFIDYSGTLIAYEELKKVYARLGQPQKLELFTYNDGHGISKPKREAAVTWFRKWLYHDPAPVKEPELKTLTDKELFCTSTGQVNTDFPDEINIVQENIALFDTGIPFANRNKEAFGERMREWLAIDDIREEGYTVDIASQGDIKQNDLLYHKFILRKENEVPLPVLTLYPPGEIKKIIVWLNEAGKNKIADSTGLLQSYLQQGYAVVLCDIRGTGETEDRTEFNDPKYYNNEYRNSMTALHIGKPLVGQRVSDIITLMRFIKTDNNLATAPVEINATGIVALPVLYAALFTDIYQLNLYHCIRSYKEILENPVEKNQYAEVIPGILKYYDIPDLVKLIGENKISFNN